MIFGALIMLVGVYSLLWGSWLILINYRHHRETNFISPYNYESRIIQVGIRKFKIQLKEPNDLIPLRYKWKDMKVLPKSKLYEHIAAVANGGDIAYGYVTATFNSLEEAESYIERSKTSNYSTQRS